MKRNITLLISFLMLLLPFAAMADDMPVRYVKATEYGGKYSNGGTSWADAKNNVQEAIDALYAYMSENKIPEGRVYIAAGTYYPSSSTETGNDDRQYLSFIIYPGVHVYGGFDKDETNDAVKPEDRPHLSEPWLFDEDHTTVLSGNLSDEHKDPVFTYDSERGTYKTVFYGNSYHVVWFATNGFIEAGKDVNYDWDESSLTGHGRALPYPASVDGCTISGGYAATQSNAGHVHAGYGAGAYMVEGSSLLNCIVEKCVAVTNGGGVYMDGGGLVDKCYIHTCQATGYNVLDGLGGGVCINFEGAVTRSYIVNNSSRSGGGVAITHLQNEYPWRSRDREEGVPAELINSTQINVYSPHATACIVSNNSSTNEAAGVYLNNGGVANHLTVTNNKCFGSDVLYYGRRQGRSGGFYILNGGQIYNSVVWGNECEANSDIQYACHTSGSTETLKPQVYYSGFDNHETTDWSGTTKTNVYSLAKANINTEGNNALYPYFLGKNEDGVIEIVSTVKTGDDEPVETKENHKGAGLGITQQKKEEGVTKEYFSGAIPLAKIWRPAAISDLGEKGVQVTDALSGTSEWIKYAHTDTDAYGDEYEPVSSLGALVRREELISPALTTVDNQEKAMYDDYKSGIDSYIDGTAHTDINGTAYTEPLNFLPDDGSIDKLPTIFVDPMRKQNGIVIGIGQENIGSSWDNPVQHINDAIHYFRKCLKKDGNGKIVYDNDGNVTYVINNQEYKYVQILVKTTLGSSTSTAGLDAYLGEQLRTASIRPCSNMRLYGGYPDGLTGTETERGNVRDHRTRITANVINGEYQNNAAHVFALANVRNVIIDGFEIYFGNANLSEEHSYAPHGEAISYGGGLIINNATAKKEDRIDMTGNVLRNSVIAHCSAPDGAAVFVNAGYEKGDDNYCKAELNIINSVIRNNTVGDGHDVTKGEAGGIITARGADAKIRMDHCDIVNNSGFPMETLSTTGTSESEGYISIYNSVIYSNGKQILANRKNIQQPLCYNGTKDHFTYNYIYLDWDARTPGTADPTHIYKVFCRDLSEHYQKWGIRRADAENRTILVDGVAQKQFFDTQTAAEEFVAAHSSEGWTTPIYLEYPFFVNPVKNVGHSAEGDKPMNGGEVSYMPQATNPMVNAATDESRNLWDRSNKRRIFGGDPDIGALECTELPIGGSVIYVTPDGAGKRDGSSWDNAIAGNTVYMLDGVEGPELATGDQVDPVSTCDRILDSEGNPVLTTDEKYCGGFGKVWMTDKKTGATVTTTVTETWTVEKNVYDNGDRAGEEEIIQDGTVPNTTSSQSTTSGGSTVDGFTVGYNYDPRYPYGEISGASRTFWRANPYTVNMDNDGYPNGKDAGGNSYSLNNFIKAENLNGFINNKRQEKYVGGLQYAVEMAATKNKNVTPNEKGDNLVQVWVSNGKYTDYKGYVMRDKTTVMGSFPAVKDSKVLTPGLNERQALMSSEVSIPKSKQAKDYVSVDYETILQISENNPRKVDNTFNTDVVKYWDDDYSMISSTNTTNYEYKDRTIVHHYSVNVTETEKTNQYILNPKFDVNFAPSPRTENGVKYYDFGTQTANYDQWHLSYPIKTNYVADIENSNNNKNKTRNIFDPKTDTQLTGSDATFQGNWIFIGNGSLTDLNFWQTIDLPAGNYKLSVDMAGGYRNKFSSEAPTNIYFKIIDEDNTDRITPVMLKTIGSSTNNDDRDTNRGMAYRYNFEFTQPEKGTLKIMIVVEDGVRNTSANGASSPTANGGDPDPIPKNYANSYGVNNPNRREFWMSNLRLFQVNVSGSYELVSTDDTSTDRNVEEPKSPEINSIDIYSKQMHRTAIRKRVLTMPDVTVPTYGGGGIGNPVSYTFNLGDNLSHTDRVFGDAKSKRSSSTQAKQEDPNYVGYTNVFWNGFTIRHGFLYDEGMAHGGGAGVCMYEGAHLQNCIVIDNISASRNVKGGGVFCDGSTSSIENCFVLNNSSVGGTNVLPAQIFAGGLFMYEGTCFNTLIAKNYSRGSGGGLGLCVGRFFNNTVAYNECGEITDKNEGYAGGGVAIATGAKSNLFMANTIIYGNNGTAIRERNYTPYGISEEMVNPFIHCFIQSEVEMTSPAFLKNIKNNTEDESCYGVGNFFTSLNGVAANLDNSPFAADKEYFGKAKDDNDFRLASSVTDCINAGTTAFAGTILQALQYKGQSESDITNGAFYKNVAAAEMPQNDVVFAQREQDCQIDMGAYEYDATMDIHPNYELKDFVDEDGNTNQELCAVFYVTANGRDGGDSSGSSPENAACAEKLQHVLDAAGRLKYDLEHYLKGEEGAVRYSIYNFTQGQQVTPYKESSYEENGTWMAKWETQAAMPLKDVKHVIVKLADGVYMPDRSTNDKMATGETEDEILTHSLIIPHGVEIWGGYKFDNDPDKPYDFFEYTRDIMTHKSILLSGVKDERSGSIGKAYHVVTFTNHLFNMDGGMYNDKDEEAELLGMTDRTILDGVFIQDGDASGVDEEDKHGGAAVVTDYAHIRNCVIYDNTATRQGGGLYLLPGAMVSGCIFKDNTADEGGAIYVVEPTKAQYASYADEDERDKAYARVYNSTIINNKAGVKGGGIFFETNIRAKGVVMWQNTASDMNNVAGTFDSEAIQEENNYPFSYCSVQNRRLPGVNNQEVAGDSNDGVRWLTSAASEYKEPWWTGEVSETPATKKSLDEEFEYKDFDGFYYTDRVSSLVRTGMPYIMYKNLRKDYPTLEMTDMAGVSRMEYEDEEDAKGADYKTYFGTSNELVTKNNKYLEIGARALNTQMDLDVESASVHMTRLFVAKSEDVNSVAANKLLTSGDPLYSLQGSSMANPFTKFSDALDYIVKLRNYKSDIDNDTEASDDEKQAAREVREKYANTRFEIFVAGGYYYPYQNAEGVEGNARSSTFVLPEAVTIVGGLDPGEMYCQAGYDFENNQPVDNNDKEENDILPDPDDINGVVLERIVTDEIREARKHFDLNYNNVYEPWEFKKETIFSGNTPRGNENEDNVFHVFTCFADPNRVGTLPDRSMESNEETELSKRKRMIILDGVTVKEGNARDYEEGSVQNKIMFYRGGGILVDGSWEHVTDDRNELNYNPDARARRDIPLTISNCLFEDNNAIQGGAIFTNGTLNVFSTSFVENYSRGPIKNKNQSQQDSQAALGIIKYVGGGAIATNGDLLCVNTIFANNEAMLGDGIETLPETAKGYRYQGFGGVIWGGDNSTVKLLNCNLVNNQAVSFPGVYLSKPNKENDMRHFGVNTVFWGNNATGVPSSLSALFSHIIDINNDIITFRSMPEKRDNKTPDNVETLYFCAYEDGTGPKDVKATDDGVHATQFDGWDKIREAMENEGTYYNNNVIIAADNDDVDGPNFQLPSTAPGRNGYNASANWMTSRVNKLTDNGWSYLTIAPNDEEEMEFKVETDNDPLKAFEVEPDNISSGGIFNWNSYDFYSKYSLNLMPLGSVDNTENKDRNYYMKFEGSGMTDQMDAQGQSYMQRISSNPLTRDEYNAYIDIGVYEYQHRRLKINQGSEIDVIWITDKENPLTGNDGYSWETATSNVQVAIETLLKSRNDHGKRLNIIAGSYKPMTVVNGNLGYTIQTSAYNDGVYTPFVDSEHQGEDKAYGVRYINLRGGYDKQIPDEGGYNYQKNKVVFSMEQRTGVKEEELNHILNIADIEQYKTTVEANWTGDEVTLSKPVSVTTGKAIPVIVEGITFENTLAQGISDSNPGGAAISYKTQFKHRLDTDKDSPTYNKYILDTEPLEAPEDGSYKLLIRNCTFSSNGKDVENPSSAILIESGAGDALIVNSVFHSNAGKPVDAVNTVILNCTSAMNGNHITLSGDHSELHNSVIWQDDQKVETGRLQYEGVTPDGNEKMTNNAISGMEADNYNNEPLSDTNNDLEEGPNFLFMNPNDEDPTKRDFRIRPSLRLLDRGDNATYAKYVWKDYKWKMNSQGKFVDANGIPLSNQTDVSIRVENENYTTDYLNLMSNKHEHQTATVTFTTRIREGDKVKEFDYEGLLRDKDLDRAFVARLINERIDRGAYECTGKGQRVIYVNPEKYGTGLETGSSWEDALGRGNLQRAIDAAAVYVRNRETLVKTNTTLLPQIAYVFVKGDNMYNEGEITLRDGVHVYGTAPLSVEVETMEKKGLTPENPTDEASYDDYLDEKVADVRSERLGIVFKSLRAESFTPTYCSSLVSMGEYRLGAVFDGLMLNNGVDNVSDKPIVNIVSDKDKIVIRNCLIIHNNVGKDKSDNPQPVVSLKGGLLYNTLIYNSLGGDVVKVGENGYVLNCTVIADDKYQKAVTYNGETSGTDYDKHVANTLAINQGGTQKMFAPYMKTGGNIYTPDDHLTNHRPYWYQLHEKSMEIDAATYKTESEIDGWLPEITTSYDTSEGSKDYSINYDDYVDFNTDRDLLGNPRMINDVVDNGCFETWLIKDGTTVTTSPSNHQYPHPGSVVYIGEGATLKLGMKSDGTTPMFDADNSFLPGYLLVKKGGSLYGQGNLVTATYVAVEKTVSSQYSLISVPFKCHPLSTFAVSYADGAVTQTKPTGLSGSTYDGEERSKWDYHYMVDNSTCWKPQSDFIPENQGWLLSLKAAPESATTYRFTGWGDSRTSYIYIEDGSDKTVTLKQYNALPNDGSAHFTKAENMGWNLVGLPWLVSDYATKDQMNVPHIIYGELLNDDLNPDEGASAPSYSGGRFYTGRSWHSDDALTLSPGEGFFTQTAVLGETETLTFKRPEYSAGGGGGGARQWIGISRQSDATTRSAGSVRFDDVVNVCPQEGADAALNYRLGSDGIKWMAFDEKIAQIYVLNAVGTRLSLVSAAPVETDVDLGVKVPEAGNYVISLPEPEAYNGYAEVWLIDQQTGQKVNLKEDSYVLTVSETGDISNRLKLRFGGLQEEMPMVDKIAPSVLKVTARNGRIPLRGIGSDEQINVYNAGGAIMYSGPAFDIGQKHLPDGVYIIRR